MARSWIRFDSKECIGCGACVTACIDQNDTDIKGGQHPRRRISESTKKKGEQVVLVFGSHACHHCKKPFCMSACPQECFSFDPETGFVLLDTEDCIGCGLCAEACPFDAIEMYQGLPDKCDGCVIRVQNGLEPACVHACLTGALKLIRK